MTSLPELQQQLQENVATAEDLRAEIDELKKELEEILAQAMTAHSVINAVNAIKAKLAGLEEKLNTMQGKEQEKQPALRSFIVRVLNNANEPLTVSEITDLVIEAGYKSGSKNLNNFKNIVTQTLTQTDEFKKATRGKTKPYRYKMA